MKSFASMACAALFCCSALAYGTLVDSRRLAGHKYGTRSHDHFSVLGRGVFVYQPRPCAVRHCVGQRVKQDNRAGSAIFVLHGSGGDASDMFDVGFEALADLHGFLVVYPEMAQANADNWGYAADIPYFSTVVTRLQRDFGIPPNMFFVCGHSAGGSMTLFLQNEVDLFDAAGSVEAMAGHLEDWDMSRRGHRTALIFNDADPVLAEFAPNGSNQAYLNATLKTLRRSWSSSYRFEQLPLGEVVSQAELYIFGEEEAKPEVRVLSFTTSPGQHTWPSAVWTESVDAAEQLTTFFLKLGDDPVDRRSEGDDPVDRRDVVVDGHDAAPLFVVYT